MRRLAVSVIAVIAALVLQLTLVDRLPLPAGGAPDLVLLVVVALGLTGGPVSGMLTGFWAGLALDVAPPASGVLGEHALVFCVVGYGCGRLSGLTDRSAASSLGVAAVATAAAEVLYVAVGLLLGDPGITWPAIRSVLPSSVIQDVLLSPFVVFLVWKASSSPAPGQAVAATPRPGLAGTGQPRLAGGAALPGSAGLAGRASWLAGPLGSGRGRKSGPAGSVRFGKSAARQGDGWVGSGSRSPQQVRVQARASRPPRLRLGAGQAGSAAVAQARRLPPGRPISLRMGQGRRGDGAVGAALGGPAGRRYPLAGGRRPAGRPRFRPGSASPGGSAGPRSNGLGSTGLGSTGLGRTGLGGSRMGGTGPGGFRLGAARLGGAAFSSAGLARAGPRRAGGLGRGGFGGATPRRGELGSSLRGRSVRGRSLRGSSLSATALPGRTLPGSRLRLGGAARSVRLRLRGRRGDGVVGGGALRAAPGGPAGFRARRQPRLFRRRPGPSRMQPRFARREPSFSRRRQLGLPRRRPRIRGGRPSFMAGRPGGRPAISRAGGTRASGRAGGVR